MMFLASSETAVFLGVFRVKSVSLRGAGGKTNMSWTDEKVTLLRQLWGEGKTAAEIARTLGGGMTRNAVIGKAHRLRLSNRVSPIQQNDNVKKPVVISSATVAGAARISVVTAAAVSVARGGGVKMADLKERMCRWPMGDPKDTENFHFCGDSTVPGMPYCAEHARMAYQAAGKARTLNAEDFSSERGDAEDLEIEIRSSASG